MTWWQSHVRPRDVFVGASTAALFSLAVVVWTTAEGVADQARAGVVGGLVTTFGTLLGYYLGNRGAEAAAEFADVERGRAAQLALELAKTRHLAESLEERLQTVAKHVAVRQGLEPDKEE